MTDLDSLTADVQTNCHISDALFARDYSLCIYLLKMREYFRWEKGYRYDDNLPERELGEWLVEREQLWQRLESVPFQSIRIGADEFDPFENRQINEALRSQALTYSGGYGSGAKPHFFLAELIRETHEESLHIFITGREHARDLTAPPAMTQDGTIYVRRESLRRLLWERLEEWRWRKQDGPMARTVRYYPLDEGFETALDAMTDAEIESVILHERGEHQAATELGNAWEETLLAVARTRTEHVLRAVRDHLADCSVTLPRLLESGSDASLHFYFANFSGMRRAIFPALAKSYEKWHETGDGKFLSDAVQKGEHYWREKAHMFVECYKEKSDSDSLEKLAEAVSL